MVPTSWVLPPNIQLRTDVRHVLTPLSLCSSWSVTLYLAAPPSRARALCLGRLPVDNNQKSSAGLLCSLQNNLFLDETQFLLHVFGLFFLPFPRRSSPSSAIFGHQNMLSRLRPYLRHADYFSLRKNDLPFILEIITLQRRLAVY